MLGARVFLSRTGLAARRPEGGSDSASGADLADTPCGIALARGEIPPRPAVGLDDGARPAGRCALERDRSASQAAPGGLAGGVDRPLGGAAFRKAGIAAGPARQRSHMSASYAKSSCLASLPATPAALACVAPLGRCRFAAIRFLRRARRRVSGSLPPASIFPATGAEPAARLGTGAAAFRAQAGGRPDGGPLPGTGVLGPPGVRVAHTSDAESATFFCTRAIPHPALAPANLARAAPVHGTAGSASCANATGDSIFNAALVALAIPPAFVRIAPGHVESPVGGGVNQDEKAPVRRRRKDRRVSASSYGCRTCPWLPNRYVS